MISVVMAVYNGGEFLEEQLRTILAQMSHDSELIIVNDKSTDNSVEVIRGFDDSRIVLIENSRNLGVVASFYRGLDLSKGRKIVLADQDDYWQPNKLDVIVSALETFDLICHDCSVTDRSLNTVRESYFEQRNSGKGLVKNYVKNGYIGCCMAFKKDVFLEARKGFGHAPMHDVWLGLIAEMYGFKVAYINDVLIKYRRHENVVSATGREKQRIPSLKSVKDRVVLAALLIYRFFIRS